MQSLQEIPSSFRYREVLHELFSHNTNPKFGLTRMEALLRRLAFKKGALRVIQVVGTNGKGSSVAFMESILKEHGILCGLFTSPHLCTARERIHINGELISESDFIQAAEHILLVSNSMEEQPSFFECMLAMALWIFKQKGVAVAILEAGLGGRLDATTAVERDIVGVSMIDLDHQNILGSTLEAIAREKIAAARPRQKVIIAKQDAVVLQTIEEQQKAVGFQLIEAEACKLPLGLFGEHQAMNAGLALACLAELNVALEPKQVALGLQKVSWPGRFEIIDGDPLIVLDGAHNPSGIRTLVCAIKQHPKTKDTPLVLVFGSMVSVNTLEKIALLKELNILRVFLHQPKNPRTESLDTLRGYCAEVGLDPNSIEAFSSWPTAVELAKSQHATLLVCGSLYTVGEARGALLGIYTDPAQPTH